MRMQVMPVEMIVGMLVFTGGMSVLVLVMVYQSKHGSYCHESKRNEEDSVWNKPKYTPTQENAYERCYRVVVRSSCSP